MLLLITKFVFRPLINLSGYELPVYRATSNTLRTCISPRLISSILRHSIPYTLLAVLGIVVKMSAAFFTLNKRTMSVGRYSIPYFVKFLVIVFSLKLCMSAQKKNDRNLLIKRKFRENNYGQYRVNNGKESKKRHIQYFD